MVAYHEGGHAIVGHVLPGCDDVHLITIVPRGMAAGHTLALPAEEHDNMSRTQLTDQLAMMLGGHAAEEVCLGEIYTGSSSDLKRATEICRKMVTQFGMSDEIGTIYLGSDQEVFVGMEFGQSREYSEEVAARIDREVSIMLQKAYERAKSILRENRDKMEMLVSALLAQETLNRAEFVALMDEGRMPDGSEADKPRSVQQILDEAKQEQAAQEQQETQDPAHAPEGYQPAPEKDDTEYLND
jgi:cell division protease FtsH